MENRLAEKDPVHLDFNRTHRCDPDGQGRWLPTVSHLRYPTLEPEEPQVQLSFQIMEEFVSEI